MTKEGKKFKTNILLWKKIATVAGIFSIVICILLIGNYLQLNKLDPLNTESINTLVERLNEDPANDGLKTEIRALDLLVRKAYFTNQWQIRTGGYLVLIGVVIVLIALQIISSARKINPEVSSDSGNNYLFVQKNTLKWISAGGGFVVVLALVFAFLSHNKLGETFTKASLAGVEPESLTVKPAVQESEVNKSDINVARNTEEVEAAGNEVIVSDDPNSTTKQTENPNTNIKSIVSDSSNDEIRKNFPAFRGPGGNGIAYQTNIPTDWDGPSGKNILWKIPVPAQGYNSPIIWEDKLFIAGASAVKREIFCYNRHDGNLLWSAVIDNVTGSPDAVPKVSDDTGHSAASKTTDGKRVYAIFSNGDLAGYNMDGKRVWARNLGVPDNNYGHSSSLIMYKEILIVQFDHYGSADVLGISGESGENLWSTKRDVKVSWASPIVVNTGNRIEVILVSDPLVASYNPETGKELWSIDCIFGEVGPSVAYSDGIVFALNEYATLVAIKIGDKPELLWEDDEWLSDIPSPVASDKYLFVPTSYGVVACYNAKTGDKIWEQEFDEPIYSSLMIVENKVYMLDRMGVMHIFEVDNEYISIAEPKLGESIVCTPVFADGRIYLKGNNNLYCIGEK